jgi:hypothetical protein
VLDPEIGYCQAQAPLAAFLLMHMPAEQAFWCLVSVCHKYLNGYYSHGMQQLQLDGDILFGLLKKVAPQVYRHLVTTERLIFKHVIYFQFGLAETTESGASSVHDRVVPLRLY